MKRFFWLMVAIGFAGAAPADVQIKFEDASGTTSTMRSNGHVVRINPGKSKSYVLFDSITGKVFMVDPKRKEILRVSLDEVAGAPPDDSLNVSLKARGRGDEIAGYKTGRFDLISNGISCGTLMGSSELIENREMKRMLEAMQGMHKLSRMRMASLAPSLTECQQASSQMAHLLDTSGFVMRYVDDQGNQMFEVKSVNTDKQVKPNYYDIPSGMNVIDMNEQMDRAAEQLPNMEELMKQVQQNGGEMTPEMEQQMQDLMKQLQQ